MSLPFFNTFIFLPKTIIKENSEQSLCLKTANINGLHLSAKWSHNFLRDLSMLVISEKKFEEGLLNPRGTNIFSFFSGILICLLG